MKKNYLIAMILSLAFFASCIEDDNTPSVVPSSDVVTVLGRITPFTEYNVTSRGVKNEQEAKLTSMAIAIFPVVSDNNGGHTTGLCEYFQYTENQAELLFTIDRVNNAFTKNALYAMYVFTNMDMSGFGVNKSLESMLEAAHAVENVDIPENGFPMIGSLGDFFSGKIDQDGNEFMLSPTVGGADNTDLVAPKINGITQNLLTIPMKAMYAKINFTIEVRSEQAIEGYYSPQFTLEGYTVNNVPSMVDFSNATNSDTDVLEKTVDNLGKFTLPVSGNKVASGANKINFSFYLPERMLSPSLQSHDGSKHGVDLYFPYPFTLVDGKYSDVDLVWRQRYKSELIDESKKNATHIVISGTFRDHQNHSWDVDYTIHLGADNYSDFNILRNSEYNNFITIRGIQVTNDMSSNDDVISIDHRVDISHTQPSIISLRRETLLDSHFEVRPLRVRKSDIQDAGDINAVKVEIVDPETTDWIRLERSFGDGTKEGSPETRINGQIKSIYIDEDEDKPAYGKRRFFTYNLIDGINANATDATLKNSTSVILPLTEDGECCWVYVDECTEVGDGVRSGIVRLTYGNLNETKFTDRTSAAFPVVNYVFSQRKLFQVTASGRQYCIEYEEEYLHNFDAEDKFGHTDEEGMKWGLNNIQLSYDHRAISFDDGLKEWLTSNARPYYDFYIEKYDKTDADNAKGELHNYAGFDFCSEIIQVVNGLGDHDTNADNNIDVLQLDETADSAIEYCYNKNKRNNKGQVVWTDNTTNNTTNLKWYLPAIDEMEDIIVSEYGDGKKTYSRFIDFQNKFYWSCQPAFIKNFAYYQGFNNNRDEWGAMYVDNTTHARATKVNYLGKNNEGVDEFDYARSGIKNEKDASGNEIYYEAWQYIWGGIFGSNHYTSENGTVTVDNRITITLKELDDQIQEGYKSRASKARIRCVRKMN